MNTTLLPAGSITLPTRLRIVSTGSTADFYLWQNGAWKVVAHEGNLSTTPAGAGALMHSGDPKLKLAGEAVFSGLSVQ